MESSRSDVMSPIRLRTRRAPGFFCLSCGSELYSCPSRFRRMTGEDNIMQPKEERRKMNRYWLLLALAGLCEVGWVSGLKHADTAFEWGLTAVAIALSFWGLLAASNKLPVGTVYAVFTGIGAAGTVLAESLIFGLPFSAAKFGLIALLIAGIAGLKWTSSAGTADPGTTEPGSAGKTNEEV